MKDKILKGTGIYQFYAGIMLAAYSIQVLIMSIGTIHHFVNPNSKNKLNVYVDLTELFNTNRFFFGLVMGGLIIIALFKIQIWLKVLKIIKDFKAETPFNSSYLVMFRKIMFYLSSIIFISIGLNIFVKWIRETYDKIPKIDLSIEEYVFMTILLYILFNGFQKGITLQEDQDLTV